MRQLVSVTMETDLSNNGLEKISFNLRRASQEKREYFIALYYDTSKPCWGWQAVCIIKSVINPLVSIKPNQTYRTQCLGLQMPYLVYSSLRSSRPQQGEVYSAEQPPNKALLTGLTHRKAYFTVLMVFIFILKNPVFSAYI